MKRTALFVGLTLALGVFLAQVGKAVADDQPANVAGNWEMTSEGRNGPMTQNLTIQQDGATIKGTIKGPRGEAPLEGSVTGNKVTFTVKRETPNGTFTIEYSGTVDGDAMKGTAHSERFDREFTAKRTK